MLITQFTHLVVMVKPGEERETALSRTIIEQGILNLPDDCVFSVRPHNTYPLPLIQHDDCAIF